MTCGSFEMKPTRPKGGKREAICGTIDAWTLRLSAVCRCECSPSERRSELGSESIFDEKFVEASADE